jgi:glutaredoxin-like protein
MVEKMSNKLLSDEDKKIIIEEYWNRLQEPVKLIFINSKNENCQYCDTIKQLYSEISEITDKIVLEEFYYEDLPEEFIKRYNIIKAPVVLLAGKNKGIIKFYGIPSGMEFPSFIETIVKISTGDIDLPKNIVDELKEIDGDINIKVFITPSCPYCPKMVSTSFMFAMVSENIDAEAWESIEFPDVAQKYQVSAVPKVVVNDKISWEGLVPPEYLLKHIKEALS